ncbi:restriction endonuclease [Wenjunlia vitaminophila]|uniref:Restriction endonuclease n=1 Tax=Wenjunlia vitaminophila TaxID=76728 RepID=A0A0T6LM10_WENVI|nr:HNH endonuclease [Wenjunlia vitaminophila]KRV46961.1 restriction endonuclease [Wenjunlia vitaminophila]
MDWERRAGELRRWTRAGQRAPHKPLLMLYALGCFQRDADAALRYSDVERDLDRLLDEFGPPRPTSSAYPFHHLVSDGVWEVRTTTGQGSPGATKRDLRSSGAAGRLVPELRLALTRDPGLLARMARVLLDANFPPSLHPTICAAAGLELELAEVPVSTRLRRRDPRARRRILVAYEYRCAFCGYAGMMDRTSVGLEAAHVRWWAEDGPDTVDNGLCLCSLHHKLFDLGALGIDRDHRVLVSQHFVANDDTARRQVLDLVGRRVLGPQPGSAPVAGEHIDWHRSEVFRGDARVAA